MSLVGERPGRLQMKLDCDCVQNDTIFSAEHISFTFDHCLCEQLELFSSTVLTSAARLFEINFQHGGCCKNTVYCVCIYNTIINALGVK